MTFKKSIGALALLCGSLFSAEADTNPVTLMFGDIDPTSAGMKCVNFSIKTAKDVVANQTTSDVYEIENLREVKEFLSGSIEKIQGFGLGDESLPLFSLTPSMSMFSSYSISKSFRSVNGQTVQNEVHQTPAQSHTNISWSLMAVMGDGSTVPVKVKKK